MNDDFYSFSKSTQMHDIVIGLFVNRYAFGRKVAGGEDGRQSERSP
jgi:hypothetical protein